MVQLKLEIRPKARAAVSKVLLVGGATRMPAVKRFLTNMTGEVCGGVCSCACVLREIEVLLCCGLIRGGSHATVC